VYVCICILTFIVFLSNAQYVTANVIQAIMGTKIDVLTLTGMVEMKVPAGTQPGAQLVMKGKGIKNVNSITK
jgi:DnaJ-class molecular chaperone